LNLSSFSKSSRSFLFIFLGIQPGDVIQIVEKGVPYVGRTERGDLLVSISIEIPKKINKKERELLEKLDKFN